MIRRDDKLTGYSTYRSRERRSKPGYLPVAAAVCLVLIALLAVVQVAHVHSNQEDAYCCPLCVAMHTVAPAVGLTLVIVMVRIGISVPVAEPRTIVRYWNPQLFTRPPPAGC